MIAAIRDSPCRNCHRLAHQRHIAAEGNFSRKIAVADIGTDTGAIEFDAAGIDEPVNSIAKWAARIKIELRLFRVETERIKAIVEFSARQRECKAKLPG